MGAFEGEPRRSCLYGDDKQTREIPYRDWIGKYPVTKLQLGRFIAADGCARRELWSDAGWLWREQKVVLEPLLWSDGECNKPLCPVVGLSFDQGVRLARAPG